MRDLPGQNLFQYLGDNNDRYNVGSSQVNACIGEAMGHRLTANNFRIWHASSLDFSILAEGPNEISIKESLDKVASKLGNTPAVTHKSYIHPALINLARCQSDPSPR